MDKQKFSPPSSRASVKAHKYLYFDHKNVDLLQLFINQFGQIEGRQRSTNHRKPILTAGQQKRLSAAIKRARFLALLPYIKYD